MSKRTKQEGKTPPNFYTVNPAKWLTFEAAAEVLGVHPLTLRAWLRTRTNEAAFLKVWILSYKRRYLARAGVDKLAGIRRALKGGAQ